MEYKEHNDKEHRYTEHPACHYPVYLIADSEVVSVLIIIDVGRNGTASNLSLKYLELAFKRKFLLALAPDYALRKVIGNISVS